MRSRTRVAIPVCLPDHCISILANSDNTTALGNVSREGGLRLAAYKDDIDAGHHDRCFNASLEGENR